MKRRPVVAQSRAELALQLRRGENLIVTLAVPLGILVFFAKVDTIPTDFKHPVDFLVPGVLVARGDGRGDGVARDRDRFRAALRRAEAARLDAAVAAAACSPPRPRPSSLLELLQVVADRRDRRRARLARARRASCPRSGCCCSAPSRSRASAC